MLEIGLSGDGKLSVFFGMKKMTMMPKIPFGIGLSVLSYIAYIVEIL